MAKRAVKRVVRDDSGRKRVILIDLETLQEVTDPTGYAVINANSNYVEPVASIESPDVPSMKETQGSDPTNIPNREPNSPGKGNVPSKGPAPSKAAPTKSAASAPAPAPSKGVPANMTPDPEVYNPDGTMKSTAPTGVVSHAARAEAGPSRPSIETVQAKPAPIDMTPKGPTGVARENPAMASRGSTIDFANPGKGRGLAALDTSGLKGKGRSGMPDQAFLSKVQEVVEDTLGPGYTVSVQSGKGLRAGETMATASGRHTGGKGADIDIVDPTGRVMNLAEDKVALDTLAQALAYSGITGIGIGTGYMSRGAPGSKDPADYGRMHVDQAFPGSPKGWGAGESRYGMDPQTRHQVFSGLGIGVDSKGNITGKLDYAQPPNPMVGPIPEAKPEPPAQPAPEPQKGVDLSIDKPTPAQLAQQGYGPQRSAEDLIAMGRTIAGELGPKTLEALAAGNAAAMQEMANIIATMENRAAAKPGGQMQSVLGGAHYNSNLKENSTVTDDNFSLYAPQIMKGLEDFYTGKVQPTNPGATHYYNPDLVTPSWGDDMTGTAQEGEHLFGHIPGEYSPSKNYSGFSRYGYDQQVGKDNSPGERGGGRFGGSGLDYSGFGMDTPSEQGSRFGGTGLGQPISFDPSHGLSNGQSSRGQRGDVGNMGNAFSGQSRGLMGDFSGNNQGGSFQGNSNQGVNQGLNGGGFNGNSLGDFSGNAQGASFNGNSFGGYGQGNTNNGYGGGMNSNAGVGVGNANNGYSGGMNSGYSGGTNAGNGQGNTSGGVGHSNNNGYGGQGNSMGGGTTSGIGAPDYGGWGGPDEGVGGRGGFGGPGAPGNNGGYGGAMV